MDSQTVFYVLGGALVVIALVLSAVGLRWEGFPGGRGLQLGITAAVVALVAATGSFAWMSAEDEQEHREAELAETAESEGEEGEAPAAEAEAEADTEAEAEATTESTTEGVDGAAVFASAGCTGCHQLEDAGSTATTGPPLDAALKDESAGFIETSIVDPNQSIAKGYPPNVMPLTYGEDLSPEELEALVQYLVEATGAKG